jgi:hypothetical protein
VITDASDLNLVLYVALKDTLTHNSEEIPSDFEDVKTSFIKKWMQERMNKV